MPTKKDLERVLEKRDWQQLCDWAEENKNLYRQLMARIYVKEGLIFWRAVEALGVFARHIEQKEQNFALELVRRYFWMLNEESGGTAWNASEAIGSLIVHCPETCGKFNWMLSGLLEDESLRDGALWGLAELAHNMPHLVDPLEERIKPFLTSEDSLPRGLAALIYALLRAPRDDFPLFRKEGPKWTVDPDLDERLGKDINQIEIYRNGELKSYYVQELWQAQTVAFWTERVTIKDLEVEVTVASTSAGLCWLGLGPSAEEKEALRLWAARWFPKLFLIRKRERNNQVIRELQEYLAGKRKEFTIPLHQIGTPFQLQVWEELRRIPYGETRSYGEIAAGVDNRNGPRAVGMANNKNPIGVIVPCHRVIGKNGDLTGYAGGLEIKQKLLELEGVNLPTISKRSKGKMQEKKHKDQREEEDMEKTNQMEDGALFTGVEHIGVKAVDLEKALKFYTEVLGFKFLYRFKPGDAELVFLELKGTVVELIEVINDQRFEDGVVNHIALRVTDIFKAVAYLKEHQVELGTSEPMSLGEGRYNFFFRGPSGEKIELYQA